MHHADYLYYCLISVTGPTSLSGMFWTEIPLISRILSPTWIKGLTSGLRVCKSSLSHMGIFLGKKLSILIEYSHIFSCDCV